jgi:hypothetical protein
MCKILQLRYVLLRNLIYDSLDNSEGKQIKNKFNEEQEHVFRLLLGQYESRRFQGTSRLAP